MVGRILKGENIANSGSYNRKLFNEAVERIIDRGAILKIENTNIITDSSVIFYKYSYDELEAKIKQAKVKSQE